MLFTRALIIGEELGLVVGKVVRIQRKRNILETEDPFDSLLSTLETFVDVLLEDDTKYFYSLEDCRCYTWHKILTGLDVQACLGQNVRNAFEQAV